MKLNAVISSVDECVYLYDNSNSTEASSYRGMITGQVIHFIKMGKQIRITLATVCDCSYLYVDSIQKQN